MVQDFVHQQYVRLLEGTSFFFGGVKNHLKAKIHDARGLSGYWIRLVFRVAGVRGLRGFLDIRYP